MGKPEVPLEGAQEQISDHARESSETWIMGVALTAAVLAVLAAVTALLAEHHADEAMLLQIRASDMWGYYQAKATQLEILEAKRALLEALGKTPDPETQRKQAHHKDKQADLKAEAEKLQEESKHHLEAHGPLSRGVTMFQVAIAVGAISVLTRRKGFWYLAFGFGLAGVAFLVRGIAMP
ncbi:MAG: DUF4337 domain-containing protein [Thermoguttaceae bacterium]|jgi:hypothetical protein